MSETTSQPQAESTFEETAFSRAAQLLADPLTDSTRKRQNLLLLLSFISLAVFFGIVSPEKISLAGVDVKLTAPLTASGTPSTSLSSVQKSALRFNQVLCPVLIYFVLTFWLSVYRDHEAAKYLREVAVSELTRAAEEVAAAALEKTKGLRAVRDRYLSLNAKRSEEREEIVERIGKIGDEFKTEYGPVRELHTAVVAEFEKLRKEGAPKNTELESRMVGLGAYLSAGSLKYLQDVQPLEERFNLLLRDPEIRTLDQQMGELGDEVMRLGGRLRERREIVARVNATVRRWKRLWYVLEVAFPSALGLFAIFVSLWKL